MSSRTSPSSTATSTAPSASRRVRRCVVGPRVSRVMPCSAPPTAVATSWALATPEASDRRQPVLSDSPDPVSQREISLKSGRFGPYVTDGETNASLRKGDDVDELTLERAIELLAERRAAPKRAPRKRKKK